MWRPNLDVARGATVDAESLLTVGPDAARQTGALVDAPGARLYACGCTVAAVRADQPLVPAEGDDHPAKALPWRCGGHPELSLPASLDGESVTSEGLAALSARALGGRAPAQGSPWPASFFDAELPAVWIAHLYALVPAGQARSAISHEAAVALGSDDAAVRAAALDFFLFHPRSPGAERVGELLRDTPERFEDVPLPWTRKRDLAHLAWKVLVERLHPGTGDIDIVALDLARRDTLVPGRAHASAILRLGELDAAWLKEHIAAAATANPDTLTSLIDAMRHWPTADAETAVATLRAADGLDASRVLTVARARLPRAVRDE